MGGPRKQTARPPKSRLAHLDIFLIFFALGRRQRREFISIKCCHCRGTPAESFAFHAAKSMLEPQDYIKNQRILLDLGPPIL